MFQTCTSAEEEKLVPPRCRLVMFRNFGGNCISGLLLVSSMSVFFLLLFLFLACFILILVASVSACDVLAVRQTLFPANEPFPLLSL